MANSQPTLATVRELRRSGLTVGGIPISDHVSGIVYLMKQEAYRMEDALEAVQKALEVRHD